MLASYPARYSAIAGTSGKIATRLAEVTAKARNLSLDCGSEGTEIDEDLAAEQVGDRRSAAAVGDMHHVDSGRAPEQFPIHMRRAADPRQGHSHLAGIALGVSDQFRTALHRKGWMYHQHAGTPRPH